MTQESTLTLVFKGTVTAVTPLTVNRPNDNFGPGKTARLPRAGMKAAATPVYFPGSTLSGTLRRLCRDIAREATIESTGNEKPFSIDTHYMLTQGVDTTNQAVSDPPANHIYQERGVRDANPLLSLFGRWKLPGHLAISDMVPTEDTAQCVFIHGEGVRTEDFGRDPSQVVFLPPEDTDRLRSILVDDAGIQQEVRALKQDRASLLKETYSESDPKKKKSLQERVAKLDKTIDETSDGKAGSKESIQRPLDGYEAIKPGTAMQQKFVLSNATPVELGLFIDTLLRFSEMPYLGAHYRNGCGEIKAEWDVMVRPRGSLKAETIGKISLAFGEFELDDFTEEKTLESAFNAWQSDKADLYKAGIDFSKFLVVE